MEFGPILVSHMLRYITAVKYGLSESELMDILACDMEVSFVVMGLIICVPIMHINSYLLP